MTEPPTAIASGTQRTVPVPAVADAVFALLLCGLGLYSFRSLYGGTQYLVIGIVGVLLGIAIVEFAVRWHKPVLAEAFISLLVFLVVGGALAARSSNVGGVIPTGHTFALLSHVGIFGWKQLLTTAPPVGNSSGLLAIPYLVGLIGGVLATSLALRTRSAALPLIGPGFVLAMGILFGSRAPTSLFLQGVVFGGLALAWVVYRHHRNRHIVNAAAFGTRRLVMTAGVLVAVALLAGLLGPDMPGAHSHARVVLSRYVVPPFNVNDQPSPLAGFRQYAEGGHLNQAVLFTVEGSKGYRPSHIRIATMDAYDGLVWGFGTAGNASSSSASSDDSFEKYGTTIPAGQTGIPQTVTIKVNELGGVWVPEVGQTTRIAFLGSQSAQLDNDVRYDAATATAAQPDQLGPGDSYVLQTVVAPSPTAQQMSSASAGSAQLVISQVPDVVGTDAAQWAGSATTAWGKVMNIAAHLLQVGKYSNGDSGVASGPSLSLPGHDAGRLTSFLAGDSRVGSQIVGDDEQYAATMALLANAVNVPARVVLGADVPANGRVEGHDVHAWVEVLLDGLGWVPIYQSQFMSENPPTPTPPTQQPRAQSAAPIQPPAISAVRSPFTAQLPGAGSSATAPSRHQGSQLVPSWVWSVAHWIIPPLIVLALCVGTILGLKRRRRLRRYRATKPSARIAGAWAELVDAERDLGRTVPANATRREQVPFLQVGEGSVLATRADASVFGPGEPTPEEIEAYWGLVDRATAAVRAGLSRFERSKAALSLRSLRITGTGGAS